MLSPHLLAQLRAYVVHVNVAPSSGEYEPFAGNGLRVDPNDEVRVDAVHGVGVAGLRGYTRSEAIS